MAPSAEEARKIIEAEIGKIDLEREPAGLYEPVKYILSAWGKRLRPVLTLLSCSIFNDDVTVAVKPAIGLEVFHNFTLLHDDIMDNADLRRGRDTVHKRWDENTAILSGDVMQVIAYESTTSVPHGKLTTILGVFNRMAREVCEGQQYDMDLEQRNDVTTGDYMKMIRLKTAVLLGACARIGAVLGDATEKDADRMYEFGVNLGLAFQLQDDYLDAFGDINKFGKNIGNDITGNKKTWLYIRALESASPGQRKVLRDLYSGKPEDPYEKIETVKSIYRELGIDRLTREVINQYTQKALDILSGVEGNKYNTGELRELATSLYYRES